MTVNDVIKLSSHNHNLVIIELTYITYTDIYGIKLRVREVKSSIFDDLAPFKDWLVKDVDCFSNLTAKTRQVGRDYGFTNREITQITESANNQSIVRTIRLYI